MWSLNSYFDHIFLIFTSCWKFVARCQNVNTRRTAGFLCKHWSWLGQNTLVLTEVSSKCQIFQVVVQSSILQVFVDLPRCSSHYCLKCPDVTVMCLSVKYSQLHHVVLMFFSYVTTRPDGRMAGRTGNGGNRIKANSAQLSWAGLCWTWLKW